MRFARVTSALALLLAAGLAGCAVDDPGVPPPTDRFYFPTGIAHVPDANGGPGFVYVVSSDFDLRFNRGTLAVVDLKSLPLPDKAPAVPVKDPSAHIAAQVKLDPFAGPVALKQLAGKGPNSRRLFVASRFQNRLQAIDVDGVLLRCAGSTGDDCTVGATDLGGGDTEQLRDAYRPLVVGDDVWVSHLAVVDSPRGSGTNRRSTLARVPAESLQNISYFNAGLQPVDGMAAVGGTLYLAGRGLSDSTSLTLRRVQMADPTNTLTNVPVRASANVLDARGLALSSDGRRMWMVGRSPDALITLDVSPGLDGLPREEVVATTLLPKGASEITVIPRGAGRGDLLVLPCADEGVVALYDDEIGRVVSTLRGVGEQPFAAAFAPRTGGGARLFVTAFGRGTMAVADIPDLDDTSTAAVLAVFGPDQNCLADNEEARPPECP